jgi:hypothetical protein
VEVEAEEPTQSSAPLRTPSPTPIPLAEPNGEPETEVTPPSSNNVILESHGPAIEPQVVQQQTELQQPSPFLRFSMAGPQQREADLRRQLLDAKLRRAAETRAEAELLGMDT